MGTTSNSGESLPVQLNDARASLGLMETDVLEQWRAAVSARDASRIGELVQFAHALRDVGNAMRSAGGSDTIDG